MTNLRSRFVVLALAVTSSAAFAQFNYTSPTYSAANANGELIVPGPHGITASYGNTDFAYGTYTYSQYSQYIGLNALGIYDFYGSALSIAYATNADGYSSMTGAVEGQASGNFITGPYTYSSIELVSASGYTVSDFTIASGGNFSFGAYGFGANGFSTNTLAELYDVSSSSFVLSFQGFNGLQSWSGSLTAGAYELVIDADATYGNFGGTPYSSGTAFVSYAFNAEPSSSAPGPLAALPFAFGVLLRRRRR